MHGQAHGASLGTRLRGGSPSLGDPSPLHGKLPAPSAGMEQGVCAPLVRGWKAAGSGSFQSSLQSAFRPPNLIFIFVIFKKEQTLGFPCAC